MEEEQEIKIEYLETFEVDPLQENSCEKLVIEKSTLQNKSEHVSSKESNGRHHCMFCQLTYTTQQCLRSHIKLKHHDQYNNYKQIVLETKRCPQCKCHICSHKFKCIESLQHHVEKEHCLDSLRLSCFYCNAAFANESEVLQHLFDKHNKIKNKIFICNVCGYRTFNASNFNHHTKSHSRQKVKKCSYCEYATCHASNLKVHERIHTNVKLYVCSFEGCDYACNSPFALKSHKLRHNSENVLLYCDKCSYSTVYKQSLTKHNISHGNKKTDERKK